MRGSRFHVSHFIPPAAKLWWERVEGSSSSPGPCTYRASGEPICRCGMHGCSPHPCDPINAPCTPYICLFLFQGVKLIPALQAVAIGLAIRFLIPIPAGIGEQVRALDLGGF